MKYESFIIHLIRYNPFLREEISRLTYSGVIDDPEEFIEWIGSKEGLYEIASVLGMKDKMQLVYQKLADLLWEIVFGKISRLEVVKRPLRDSDLFIFFEDKFTGFLTEKLKLTETSGDNDVLGELFNMNEIREILTENGLIKENKEYSNSQLIGSLMDNRSRILSDSYTDNIWVFLDSLINSHAENILAGEENFNCKPHEVLQELVLHIIDSDLKTQKKKTGKDGSQIMDSIAITIIKSEIKGIMDAYRMSLEDVIRRLKQTNHDDFTSLVYISFHYYFSKYYQKAVEELILSNRDKMRGFLDRFLTTDDLPGGFKIEVIDKKLIQFFILSGLEVPDPFSFRSLFQDSNETTCIEKEVSVNMSPMEVADKIKRKYENEYGADGFESVMYKSGG